MAKKLIIWDFDGVIVDTAKLGHVMMIPRMPDLSFEEYLNLFNGNPYESYDSIAHREIESDFDEHAYYAGRLGEFRIVPPIRLAIESLVKDYTMGIITSSRGSSVAGYLDANNLRQCFQFVLGYEAGLKKTDKIKKVLEELNVDPADAVFITDTLGDLKEAAHCHVSGIAVSWGYHNKEKLQRANPLIIVDKPESLEAAIRNILR